MIWLTKLNREAWLTLRTNPCGLAIDLHGRT